MAGHSNSDTTQSRSCASDLPSVMLNSKVTRVSMSQLLFQLRALLPTHSVACRVGGTTWPYSTADMLCQMSDLCSSCFLTSYTDPFFITRLHFAYAPKYPLENNLQGVLCHLAILLQAFSLVITTTCPCSFIK